MVRGPRRFALPRGRIAQLVEGKVRVLGLDLREQAVVGPGGLRAFGALADGTLLVVGGRETCILARESGVAWCFPKLTVGADLTWAWGDSRAPRRFWLMEGSFLGGNELPAAAGTKVKPLGELEAPEDAVPFGDGRMAVLGAVAIFLFGPSGVRRVGLPDGLRVEHVVAVDGDVAWASDGAKLFRLDLSGEAAVVDRRAGGGGTIVSLDADAERVATLVAEGAPGARPRWSVEVLDARGAVRWRAATPFQPPMSEQGHLAVALGRFDSIVAVGDERRLAVWDLASQTLLAERGGI